MRRPTARGAWPPHARLANRLLALRIRRRAGVRLRDLGPMRAARREALLGLQVADRRRIDDGGFWSLGFRRPRECDLPVLLHDVPMSTDHTGADQRLRLAEAGMHVRILPTLRDVDTADDADHVAALTPASRFRAELDALQER